MACVTDPVTGNQFCGMAVNPVVAGESVTAGVTFVPALALPLPVDVSGLVVGEDDDYVLGVFPSTTVVAPNGEPVWVQVTTPQAIPSDRVGRNVVVMLGPAAAFVGVQPGDTFIPYVELPGTVQMTVTVGSGAPPAPGGGQTGGGGQAQGQPYITVLHVDLAPSTVQPGQPVTATVIVGNEGVGPGSATVVGSDTLGRTWGPVGTGTIPPGGSVTLTLTSGPTPATAAGQTVSVGFTIQGSSQPAVGNTFTVASPATTGMPPAPPAPPGKGLLGTLEAWWATLSPAQRAALVGGGTLFVAGTAMALALALERR